jgi:2,3-bisphosphoglycerate-independent phosphoglycerate mutase
MRFVIFLGDGMADYPVPELGNRTPLQVAKKPSIDRIARHGRCGQFITVEDDMPPGSEVANLTVLGYDPHECYQGRGVIEAASMGVELSDTDVALRCNLICIKDGRIKNHSAGHISTEEAKPLIEAMNAESGPVVQWPSGPVSESRALDHLTARPLGHSLVRFFPGISYRHLCVLKQGSPDLDCAPPHDHVGERALDLLVKPKNEAARATADLLNSLIRRSWEILPGHGVNVARTLAGKDPANSIWFWSPGRKPKMKTYKELFGLTGAVISAVDLIRGLGVYAGLDVVQVEGATGLIDTNYEGKADVCLAALADHDFVYVHVEATDEAGHSRDVKQKIQGIEYLDSRLIARVMKGLEDNGIEAAVAVLPDHLTPVAKGNHVHGPVPVAIAGPGVEPDSVQTYDEESVKPGSLGVLRGGQFIRTLLGRQP